MKILFYRYGSICEPDIIEGFEELGHTVSQITEEITNKKSGFRGFCPHRKQLSYGAPAGLCIYHKLFPLLFQMCVISLGFHTCAGL